MTNKGKKVPPAPIKQGKAVTSQVQSLSQKVDALTKRIPPGTFAKIGATLGSIAGPKGAAMGGAMGAGISRITGRGDYVVNSNTLAREGGEVDVVPKFVDVNKHTVRVSHREFLGNITAPLVPAAFSNNVYTINAGDSRSFPWLSPIAKSYSQYRVKGMVFCYKSTFSDYAAAGALGTVIMATNYNVADNAYATKIAMENSEFAVSTKPSLNIMHPIECAPEFGARGEPYYVRDLSAINSGAVSDNRFYDLGSFQIATEGLACAANTVLGELWVSYDIELIRPLISPNYQQGAATLIYDSSGTGYGVGLGVVPSNLVPTYCTTVGDALGFVPIATTTTAMQPDSDVGIVAAGTTPLTQTLKFTKNGNYYVTAEVAGTGITGTPTNVATNVGTATSVMVVNEIATIASGFAVINYTLNVAGVNGPNDYVTVTSLLATASTTVTGGLLNINALTGRPTLRAGY